MGGQFVFVNGSYVYYWNIKYKSLSGESKFVCRFWNSFSRDLPLNLISWRLEVGSCRIFLHGFINLIECLLKYFILFLQYSFNWLSVWYWRLLVYVYWSRPYFVLLYNSMFPVRKCFSARKHVLPHHILHIPLQMQDLHVKSVRRWSLSVVTACVWFIVVCLDEPVRFSFELLHVWLLRGLLSCNT